MRPVSVVDVSGECCRCTCLQLVELAIREDRLLAAGASRRGRSKHVGISQDVRLGGALHDGQLQVVEEDLLELIARAEHEVLPGDALAFHSRCRAGPGPPSCRAARSVDVDEGHPASPSAASTREGISTSRISSSRLPAARRGSKCSRSARGTPAAAATKEAARSISISSKTPLRSAGLRRSFPVPSRHARARVRAARAPPERVGRLGIDEVPPPRACRRAAARSAPPRQRSSTMDARFPDRAPPSRRASRPGSGARWLLHRGSTRAARGSRDSGATAARSARSPPRSGEQIPTRCACIASVLVVSSAMPMPRLER